MKTSEALIVLGRVSIELCAYYNAKYMYSLGGTSFSPTLTTYIGHSLLLVIILKDLKDYKRILKRETGYSFKKFFIITFLLTIIFNTSHLPKYYSLNVLSDISLVATSGLSVVFTDIISGLKTKYSAKSKFCFLTSGIGVFFLFLNHYDDIKKCLLLFGCILGSLSVGIYNVTIKKCVEYTKPLPILDRKPFKKKRKVEYKFTVKRIKSDSTKIEFFEKKKQTSIPFSGYKKMFRRRMTAKMRRKLKFLKHYIGMTGLITFLFYWPFVIISDPHPVINYSLFLFILLATFLSFLQNILYYALISSKSPQFVQVTGIILQPTITMLEMIMHGFKGYLNSFGFILIFMCFIMIT